MKPVVNVLQGAMTKWQLANILFRSVQSQQNAITDLNDKIVVMMVNEVKRESGAGETYNISGYSNGVYTTVCVYVID